MVRRVKAYLGNIDDKLIEDEAKLQSLSEECEPPPNYIQKQSHAVQVPISIFDINTILVERAHCIKFNFHTSLIY